MSRAKKDKQINESELASESKNLDLRKAINIFKLNNPEKAVYLKNIEIIKLYAIKHVPTLEASQEVWNNVLSKF